MRICEVYPGKSCVLFNKEIEERCSVLNGEVPFAYLPVGMRAVGHTVGCLEKIFEEEHTSDYGIYLVRLFIEGVWRYTIIDDLVPVVIREKKAVPLLLST